jgi:uncharacterized membrane protein (DUF4010 family)
VVRAAQHKTPIRQHLKTKHFWLDLSALILIYVAVIFIEYEKWVKDLLKITALMGSIEILSFFSFHLLGRRKGLLLQGLLSGFISSTMFFFKVTQDISFKKFPHNYIHASLLLSVIGMLMEMIGITVVIAKSNLISLSLPILIQILFLTLFAFIFVRRQKSFPTDDIIIDHPILWRKVLKFSIILGTIIFFTRKLGIIFPQLSLAMTFVISLFETHAIWAANLINLSQNEIILLHLHLILFGNIVSKSFLVLKFSGFQKNKALIYSFLASLLASSLTILATSFA